MADEFTAYRGTETLRRGWTTGSCAAAASQAAARVPKISSASQPSRLTCTKPSSVRSCLSTGICWANSSGIPWRVAL